VSLYQTTALLPDCFLKAMQRKMPVTLGMGTTLLQNFHLLSLSNGIRREVESEGSPKAKHGPFG